MLPNAKEIQVALRECLTRWGRQDSEFGRDLLKLSMVRAHHQPTLSDWNNLKQFVSDLLVRFQSDTAPSAQLIYGHYVLGEGDLAEKDLSEADRRQAYRVLNQAMRVFAQFVLKEEKAFQAARRRLAGQQIAYLRNETLVGRDLAEKELVERIHDASPDGNTVIFVSGLGGIGKTSLLIKAIRQVAKDFLFDHILWIEYRPISLSGDSINPAGAAIQMMKKLQEMAHIKVDGLSRDARFAQVQHALQQDRHLIVIDNIEEVPVAMRLQEQIAKLGGQNVFVVGSRVQPRIGAQNYIVPPLSAENSIQLLRYIGKKSRLTDLESLSDRQLTWIYEVVGGNPLALKLAANLIRSLPYKVLLAQLRGGSTQSAGNLFKHIFDSHWRQLSEEGRELLCAMLEADEHQADPEFIQMISGLSDSEFWNAVEELVQSSLLEVHGTLNERVYGIHRLTSAFLEGNCE